MTEQRDIDLLDYFAARAMAAYIARNTVGEWDHEDIAVISYGMAEAMCKERIVAIHNDQ